MKIVMAVLTIFLLIEIIDQNMMHWAGMSTAWRVFSIAVSIAWLSAAIVLAVVAVEVWG